MGRVFKVLGGSKKRYAELGEIVVIAIQSAEPRKMVKKKDVVYGVVVRQKKAYRRKDGSYVSFDDNAVVLIDKEKKEPRANRVFGPIPRELSEAGYQKIVSLAPEVVQCLTFNRMKIRKGDTVKVTTGKDKGKTGTILLTIKEKDQVVIEGVNVVKRHSKNKRTRSQGQIIEKSMPIHVSNVSLMEGDKTVRAGYSFEGEGDERKKVRISKATGKKIQF